MQCIACHFENLPGLACCGRCGSRLDFASCELSWLPPRATERGWFRQLWFAVAAFGNRSADGNFRESLDEALHGRGFSSALCGRVLFRMTFPGGAQLALARRFQGTLLLALWLLLLGVGAATHAPFWRMQILGMLAAVRGAGALNLALADCSGVSSGMKCVILSGLLPFVLVDLPLASVLARFPG